MDEHQLLFNLFSNVGVPAAVCFYTLYGVKKSLDKLTVAIDTLKDSHGKDIANLKDEIKELKSNMNYLQISRRRSLYLLCGLLKI